MPDNQFDHDSNPEASRLERQRWRRWGPYLSNRQWGTVREDYSPHGSYWDYFSFDTARRRAYRWGEDGIGGISDDRQLLCLSLALWNHRDPFLKERFFGLSNSEGNHGEDVKEQYYYLDALPSHAYLKMLYKYPQCEFPYQMLRDKSIERGSHRREFELIETGCFDDDRYFDVFIEYGKASPDDILMCVTAVNRGPEPAPLDLLPHLWFRNTWSWDDDAEKPVVYSNGDGAIASRHLEIDDYFLYLDGNPDLIFCDNDTHPVRVHGFKQAHGYFKDAFHDYVVRGDKKAVNPARAGTKSAAHYSFVIEPGASVIVRARLSNTSTSDPFAAFEETMDARRWEADRFYAQIQSNIRSDDALNVQRQAFAGLIWNKQFYHYDVWEWLNGDPNQPPPPKERKTGRNSQWQHLHNADIISMPDKWEFPWYATWDVAFHCITFALIDSRFAKDQLALFISDRYMHPNGHLPAYEGEFSDVNPPVHAWAAWRVFEIDRDQRGDAGDIQFLERMFHKLLINFTWWVNRKDEHGLNVFQGGFLGLDNIGVFDRGNPLPHGGHIVEADATSWMAMYSLDMMRIALELAKHNTVYEDIASKFFEHFLHIAKAMHNIGDSGIGLWDDEDKFYYDILRPEKSPPIVVKARSVVGLIPLFAVCTLDDELLSHVPEFVKHVERLFQRRPDLEKLVSHASGPGTGRAQLLALATGEKIREVLSRVLDEEEFLSNYGVRALSRFHAREPFCIEYDKEPLCIDYEPGESHLDHFGGNSNWRGPIWFPVNYLLIESLREFHRFYGENLKLECPKGSGVFLTLAEISDELSRRLCRIFLKDEAGARPAYGDFQRLNSDPHFQDLLEFHEFFHGDTGRGCGAHHQTGWTALIANIMADVLKTP